MATYYWVGGAGTRDATTTTNWASSSGGAGGAGVPTSVDDVIFDVASNATAYIVTVGADAVCQDITVAGPLVGNVTFSLASTSRLNCFGSFTLPATGAVWTGTGAAAINFLATSTGKTITTNGVTLTVTAVVLNSATGGWTLGSALTTTSTFTLTAGSFNTSVSNYTLTCTSFTAQSVATINANASTIVCSLASPTFAGGGLTFFNVSFTSTAIGTVTITGANTFNNLTFAARATFGFGVASIGDNQIVSGTLTLGSGTDGRTRLSVQSSVVGTPRTLTVATLAAPTDVDFRDIVAAGASAPWSGTRLGNCLGNSNITFDAGKTVYWNLAAGGAWNGTAWAASSGGAAALTNFPLAQDTAIIENTGLNTSATISLASYNVGTINMSSRSNAMTLSSTSTNMRIYGNVIFSSAVTHTASTGGFTFNGQGVIQQLTTAGITFAGTITVDNATGTLQLQDNCTCSSTGTAAFGLTSGTLDLNEFNLSMAGRFTSSNTNIRSIDFGSVSKILLTYNAGAAFIIVLMSDTTNFSYSGTSYIELSGNNTAGTRTVSVGTPTTTTEAQAINILVSAGSDTVQLSNDGSPRVYRGVNFTGFSGTLTNRITTIYGNLVFSSTMTVGAGTGATTFAATSGTQQITTNGQTLDSPLTFNGIGGTFAFQDALTQGSTRAFTITNGTVQLKNGVTSTVGAFATSGTNQKFLQSTTPGSQATLSQASGTVDASYLTIRDINAIGGATWNAFVNQQNIDAGNNDGWDFGISPIVGSYEYTYQLRSFTQPRRF